MKKFVRKAGSALTFDVKGIGEIKTTCKTFGNCIATGTGDKLKLVSVCAKCTQDDEVKRACLVKSGKLSIKPVKEPRERKTGEPREPREKKPSGPRAATSTDIFWIVVDGLHKQHTKEKILKTAEKAGHSEKNAKNKLSSVGCCFRALTGTAQKTGAVTAYAEWILAGRKGTAPTIDGSSRSYTEKTYSVMKQLGM